MHPLCDVMCINDPVNVSPSLSLAQCPPDTVCLRGRTWRFSIGLTVVTRWSLAPALKALGRSASRRGPGLQGVDALHVP